MSDASRNDDNLVRDDENPGGDSADAAGERTAEVERLAAELAAANERVLRAQAELENFRKRARRELDDELRYANLPLVSDLLPVLDNIHRALAAAGQNETSQGLVDGVKMVADQLQGVLARFHCRRIEADKAEFDPHLHQAIGQQPSERVPAGHVLFVALEGYQLHDRVVRPAQVIVSTGPAKVEREEGGDY
jgi:molecular chaperone GrpE